MVDTREVSQMNNRNSIFVLMALAVLLVGCGPGSTDSPSLEGTQWMLVTMEGKSPLAGTAISACLILPPVHRLFTGFGPHSPPECSNADSLLPSPRGASCQHTTWTRPWGAGQPRGLSRPQDASA